VHALAESFHPPSKKRKQTHAYDFLCWTCSNLLAKQCRNLAALIGACTFDVALSDFGPAPIYPTSETVLHRLPWLLHLQFVPKRNRSGPVTDATRLHIVVATPTARITPLIFRSDFILAKFYWMDPIRGCLAAGDCCSKNENPWRTSINTNQSPGVHTKHNLYSALTCTRSSEDYHRCCQKTCPPGNLRGGKSSSDLRKPAASNQWLSRHKDRETKQVALVKWEAAMQHAYTADSETSGTSGKNTNPSL
jgi:hypothetical protein